MSTMSAVEAVVRLGLGVIAVAMAAIVVWALNNDHPVAAFAIGFMAFGLVWSATDTWGAFT